MQWHIWHTNSTWTYSQDVAMEIDSRNIPINLVILETVRYDVILSMDWLSEWYAKVYCKKCCICFLPSSQPKLWFQARRPFGICKMMSMIKVKTLKKCELFLVCVILENHDQRGGSGWYYKRFPNVLSEELLGLLHQRTILWEWRQLQSLKYSIRWH